MIGFIIGTIFGVMVGMIITAALVVGSKSDKN